MKEKIADMRKADPSILSKDAFKKGAELWNKEKTDKTEKPKMKEDTS